MARVKPEIRSPRTDYDTLGGHGHKGSIMGRAGIIQAVWSETWYVCGRVAAHAI